MDRAKGWVSSSLRALDSRVPWWIQTVLLPQLLTKVVFSHRLLDSVALTATAWVILFLFMRFVYSVFLYPRYFTPFRHLPTPKERSWLWGNMKPHFLEPAGMTARRIAETVPNDGGLIRYYGFLSQERILPTTPKAFAQILVHDGYNYQKTPQLKFAVSQITGKGVGYAEGDEHKYQRKHLAPAFHAKNVKSLYPKFWKKGIEMAYCLERHMAANKNRVNMREWMARTMLDIMGVAGMDHDFQALQNPDNELYQAFKTAFSPPPQGFRYFAALGSFINPAILQSIPVPRNSQVIKSSDIIRRVASQLIQQKRQMSATDNDTDIISVALTGGALSEENLTAQMMTFLGGGTETTATTLQWFVWAMCKHQNIQTRLREEVRANLPSISGSDPMIPSAAAVDSLPYLHAVCSEVLRFFPSTPMTIHVAQKDTHVLDTAIPAGTAVVIAPEAVNHDPRLWGSDAAEFNPERWMAPGAANSGGATSNYAMMTFIHGPRACIGKEFVKSEVPILAAILVARFKLELQDPEEELGYESSVSVFPKNGVNARLEVIPGW